MNWCEHICWSCGRVNDRVKAANNRDSIVPVDGDLSFCFSCGEWGIFDQHLKGGVRKPTDDEFVEIAETDECRRTREVWVKVVEQKQ